MTRLLLAHTGSITRVAISSCGSFIGTAGSGKDKTLRVWKVTEGNIIVHYRVFKGFRADIKSICFFHRENRFCIAGAGRGGIVRVWDVEKEEYLAELFRSKYYRYLPNKKSEVDAFCVNKDGTQMGILTFEGIRGWTLWEGEEKGSFGGHVVWESRHGDMHQAFPCVDLQYDLYDRRMVSIGCDKTSRVWDAKTGALLHTLQHDSFSVIAMAFNPANELLTLCNGHVWTWNMEQGTRISHTSLEREGASFVGVDKSISLQRAAFTMDGRGVIVGNDVLALPDMTLSAKLFPLNIQSLIALSCGGPIVRVAMKANAACVTLVANQPDTLSCCCAQRALALQLDWLSLPQALAQFVAEFGTHKDRAAFQRHQKKKKKEQSAVAPRRRSRR